MKLKFLAFILLPLLLAGCSNEKPLTLEQAKSMVIEHLKQDETISEIKIIKFDLFQKTNEETVYTIEYLMKPIDPHSFILAGSRMQGEDGWVTAYQFVSFNKNNELRFSTSP